MAYLLQKREIYTYSAHAYVNNGELILVSEEKAKRIIIENVYRTLDALGYGVKKDFSGTVVYYVKGKPMTLSEYQEHCIKKELKKFGIKYH